MRYYTEQMLSNHFLCKNNQLVTDSIYCYTIYCLWFIWTKFSIKLYNIIILQSFMIWVEMLKSLIHEGTSLFLLEDNTSHKITLLFIYSTMLIFFLSLYRQSRGRVRLRYYEYNIYSKQYWISWFRLTLVSVLTGKIEWLLGKKVIYSTSWILTSPLVSQRYEW